MKLQKLFHLKITSALLLLLLCAMVTFAQKETESVEKYRVVYSYQAPQIDNPSGGNNDGAATNYQPIPSDSFGVAYHYDARLQKLIDLHRSHNANVPEGPGFRIQIYAGGKMETANETKTDFLQAFSQSEMGVYQSWQPPHFRVRVGDFLSRNEAMRALAKVRQVFPDAFVVNDKIKMPKFKKHLGGTTHDSHPNESQD
jgi:hypothetical protein